MEHISTIVKTALGFTLHFTGLLQRHRRAIGRRSAVPILLYHEVAGPTDQLHGEASVSFNNFRRQIDFLARHYNVISMAALMKCMKRELAFPENPVLLTFDGGYKGNYTYAYPLLRQHGIPAVIYVISGAVDGNLPWQRLLYYAFSVTAKNKISITPGQNVDSCSLSTDSARQIAYKKTLEILRTMPDDEREKAVNNTLQELEVSPDGICSRLFLSWKEIGELARDDLIEIGSHSVNHFRLNELPDEDALYEIVESKRRIESEINQPVRHFCYPDGFFSQKIKAMTKDAGYQTATIVEPPPGNDALNSPDTDPFELKRIYVDDQPFVCVFGAQVNGTLGRVARAIKRVRGMK